MEEEEEEETALAVDVMEERRKRAKAMKSGEMRARVSWTLVLAAFLALPPFQRDRVEEMGFGAIFRTERMRVDPALTQAPRSRWDTEANAFVFPWGHMIPSLEDVSRITGLKVYGKAVSGYTYPSYHDIAERLLDLPVERRSSLLPRVALQESLGLFEAGKNVGESEDDYLERLARVSRRELASEPGPQADLDLRRFLVGGYAWGAAFLAHQFNCLKASDRQTSTSGFYPFLQVWAYLHLPALGRGELTRPGLAPIARRWESRRDTRHLADQLERLQEAIDSYPYLNVVWQPYLGEGDEGQLWLAQARPCFGRSVWLHALNLVLPLNLFLSQRSLGFRQSVVEFPVRDRFRRQGRSFRGLHDTTDWQERAREQIENLERKGKSMKSTATTDDAYLRSYALKYGGKVYKSARHKVVVASEVASLRALLLSATHDREAARRETEELRRELEIVRRGASGASSSRGGESDWASLQAQLTAAISRAEEAERHLEDRHQRELQTTRGDRDQLRIRAETAKTRATEVTGERDQLRTQMEAAEARVAAMTSELAALRVQRSPVDREELERLQVELRLQESLAQRLQQIVTDIGRSRSRSRSAASASRATGGTVGQYLASSSSRRRNEAEERRRQDEGDKVLQINVGVPHPRISTIYRELGLGRHPEVLEGREGDVGYPPRINLPPEVMKLLLHTCPFHQEIGGRLDLMRRDKGAWLLEGVRPPTRKRSWFGRIICSWGRPRLNIPWGEVAWF
ncbi:hypothetical protein Taro_046500 [Colocasia esculenta]|uniref:Aminotransferase-like plant mobile domain-containing protein n=1 Tax=Colocasia esculenta TaxID=4460 RepID=A0A843X5N1_COLES|nr:hypothetical protein [Colocasia esculenta]